MQAITFRYNIARFALATVLGRIHPRGFLVRGGPITFGPAPEPKLHGDDWVLVRTSLCGICGSDSKQVFLHGAFDNPITSLISFPHTLGHEAVGVVERVGSAVTRLKSGDRVVLNPWLSCAPRGVTPPCSECVKGNYYACENFTGGRLPPGVHIGNCVGVPGGYATKFAAHDSQLFRIPDGVTNEQAVLADPFAVSFHGILKCPPRENATALVYGAGTLGLLTVMILRALYPSVRVVVIAKYAHQRDVARECGAHEVLAHGDAREIVRAVARLVGAKVHEPWHGKPWLLRGVDVVYDTIGSADSLENGVRVAQPHATLVVTGVDTPARFEWTPVYFKEVSILGSNAFGIESFEGQRKHAMEFYLDLLEAGRIDPSRLITHRFRLEEYPRAFVMANQKSRHGMVKGVFEF